MSNEISNRYQQMCRLYVKSDCNLGSTAMNYPRSKFSKHSDYFLINYGYCSNCATCAISGKVAGTHIDIRR